MPEIAAGAGGEQGGLGGASARPRPTTSESGEAAPNGTAIKAARPAVRSEPPDRARRDPGMTAERRSSTAAARSSSPARSDALYERHLLFDNVVDPAAAGPRERFEAVARSVRDILSQRWVRTERDVRAREPQARLLPLDGVPDRPLAGQQHHQPAARPAGRAGRRREEPRLARAARAGARRRAWATAGSAGWRRASSTRWPRCSSRPWATACATSTASSGRRSRTAGSRSSRTTGCAAPTRGRSRGPHETVEVKLELLVRGARRRRCGAIPGRPSTSDRHPVRPPGRRLRRQDDQHAPALGRRGARTTSTSRQFSGGDFVGALAETLAAEIADARPLPRRLDRRMGQGLRFVQEYFLVACSLADLVRRFRARQRRLARAARQGRHPAQRHASRRWPSPS